MQPVRLRAASLVALLLACTSCGSDSGTGPGGGGTLRSGVQVSGSVGGAERRVARFRYVADPEELFEVRFRLRGDSTRLFMVRATGDTVALSSNHPDPADTSLKWMVTHGGVSGGAFQFLVAAPGGSGTFELTVNGQNRAPESHSATVTLGEVFDGVLEDRLDADVYRIDIPRDTDVVLTARILERPSPQRGATVRVRRLPADTCCDLLASAAPDAAVLPVGSVSVGRLTAGRYEVAVEGVIAPLDATGSLRYRVQLRGLDRRPEGRSADIALGDTIGSDIEYVGDADEYVLHATAGDSVVVFAQAGAGLPAALAVVEHDGPFQPANLIARAGPTLLGSSVGRLRVPASGTMKIRVEGGDAMVRAAGAYRLLAYRPDTLPEGHAATIVLGEQVTGALHPAGDIDAYALDLAAPAFVNLTLAIPTIATGESPALQVRQPNGLLLTVALEQTSTGPARRSGGSGRRRLEPGSYSLRVASRSADQGSYAGPYTLGVTVIDSLPESHAMEIALGDTVRGERIDAGGDIDWFSLSAGSQDTVVLHFAPAASGTPLPLVVDLLPPCDCQPRRTLDLMGGASVSSQRSTLLIAGPYRVRVSGMSDGREPGESGAYQLRVERFTSRPESHVATIAVGETVADERIDFAGDVDGFVLTGPPGGEVIVGLRGTGQPAGKAFMLSSYIDATGVPITRESTTGALLHVGRFVLPASGRLRLGVSELDDNCNASGCPTPYSLTGAYTLSSYLIDRRPEGRTAVIAIGDTIAERIDPDGDIDEYTFDGVAGDRLLLQFETPDGISVGRFLQVRLVEDVPSAFMIGIDNSSPLYVNSLEGSAKPFVLPRTGRYRVRVEGGDDSNATGRYLVRVARQP